MSLKTAITATAICLAALAAGCGGEEEGEPIPQDVREQLESRLSEAENRLDNNSAGACEDIIDDTEPAVSSILATVPSDVDTDVRRRLNEGFDRLWELVADECRRLQDEQETDTETTPEPLPPPPPETETETVPTTPEPPPQEGGEGDGNQGNGNGGSGQGNGQGGDPPVEVPGSPGGGVGPPGDG